MSVLLIAEHNNKNLKPFTLNAITAASKIDAEVHVLVAGSGSESVAKDLGVDITNRVQQLKVEEPPKRKAGIKVANVAELVSKLKNEAKVI